MKPIFLYLFLLLSVTTAMAQQDRQLQQLLTDQSTLSGAMQVIKNYYNNPTTKSRLGNDAINSSLKHWKRWEWYMSSRLGPNGELVNINRKMLEATGLETNRSLQPNNANRVESTSGSWAAIGPYNTTSGIGRVDRLAFNPANANVVYAGSTAGGLWRTTDAGTNWSNITPNISCGGISGIVVDPGNTNSLFILTGDGDSKFLSGGGLVQAFGYIRFSIGVLRSTDGGVHWKKTGDFPGVTNKMVGFRLVMHPTLSNILYACTSEGLFWTTNGGQTWGLQKGGGRFYNLKFKPGSGSICYATGTNGNEVDARSLFWRSTSSGVIWDSISTINNQINNPTSRVELAVAPSNDNVVYLLCGGTAVAGQFKGLLRSDNMGLNFTSQSTTPNIVGRTSDGSDNYDQSTYDLSVTVSYTTSATVVTGAVFVWRSLNSGTTWAYRGAGIHADIHEVAFHPADNKLWAATDGGVYSSTDNGITWTTHFQDMNISQFYRMAVSPDNYLDMIAGAQDNGTKKRNGGSSFFDDISGSDGFTVDFDQTDDSVFYAILNRSVGRFTNNGSNLNFITPAGSNNPFAMSLATHTSLANALFIGSDSVWRSINGGTSWSVSATINGGWFLRTCPSNSNRIYAAGGAAYDASTGTLRRSDNAGVTWVADVLSNNTGFPASYTKITSINVDPSNSANVWVTFGGFSDGVKVYSSNDAGVTWSNRSGSLPNVPINCIALDNNNNAYLGTDNGVYYRGTGTNDWIPFYNNLPYVPVTDLIISESEGLVRAATFGRGIWSSSLRSTCVADINITGRLEGQEFYEVSNSVTTTAFLDTSEGTKVQMRGGLEVQLLHGFTAGEATQFRALIGPCGGSGTAGFRPVAAAQVLVPQQLLPVSKNRKALLHIQPKTTGLETIVTVIEAGHISFVLADTAGSHIREWPPVRFARGATEKNLLVSQPNINPGFYYLHLFHNGAWQHMQEFEIK